MSKSLRLQILVQERALLLARPESLSTAFAKHSCGLPISPLRCALCGHRLGPSLHAGTTCLGHPSLMSYARSPWAISSASGGWLTFLANAPGLTGHLWLFPAQHLIWSPLVVSSASSALQTKLGMQCLQPQRQGLRSLAPQGTLPSCCLHHVVREIRAQAPCSALLWVFKQPAQVSLDLVCRQYITLASDPRFR